MATPLPGPAPLRHWFWPLMVIVVGAFMAILDSSIVNVALPTMMQVFGTTVDGIQWVVTIYMLVLGVVVPASGWLGERLGLRRLYLLSLALFTLGSALCGLAWDLPSLTFFRVLQGIGGGMIMPTTMSMLYRMVPREKMGTAMGFWGLAALFAPAVGPTLGGYLVEFIDWRLIFYINVPIGILGVLLALMLVPEFPSLRTSPFDLPGFLSSAAGLFLLLLALSEGQTWGWTSEPIVLLLFASGSLLLLFTLHELTSPHPLLELRVFGNFPFSLSLLIMVITMVGLFGGVFYIPLFLQTSQHLGALETGLILMPGSITAGILMPIAGRLYDRIGARPLVFAGLLIMAYTTWLFTRLSLSTPASTLMLWNALRGVGMGLAMMPNMTGGMASIPDHLIGRASAINNGLQRVGASFGLSAITAFLQSQVAVQAAAGAAVINPGTVTLSRLIPPGMPPSQGIPLALTQLYGIVQQNAFVTALDQVFVLLTAVTLAGAALALLLKPTSAKAAKSPLGDSDDPRESPKGEGSTAAGGRPLAHAPQGGRA